ncbi:MAG: Glu/Leu/Phe/Val family dehydrogenase [Chthoniobacterales bacterium]
MQFFNHGEFDNHEHVSFFSCSKTGLKAIIAIHNTNLGPALGGCRMWRYQSDEQALHDVLRLSKGMTYKAALAGVPIGGGKSVIMGDPKREKTPEMMESMGRAVETLGGKYIIAEDVGTCVEDMNQLNKATNYVTGGFQNNKGSGDPSPTTAYGVFLGLKPAVKHRLRKESLQGLTVSVQGLGSVGYHLCKFLHAAGVKLYVCDIDEERVDLVVNEFGAIPLPFHEIYDVKADIFAPCALGGILNDETIKRLKVSIVAGAANNPLEAPQHGTLLSDRDILYAPDYVINAAGLIRVYYEYAANENTPFSEECVFKHVEKIPERLEMIFAYADQHGISTATAADALAEQIFKKHSARQILST